MIFSDIGETYMIRNKYESAEICFRRSVQIDGNNFHTLRLLADALNQLGRSREALQLYQKVTNLID